MPSTEAPPNTRDSSDYGFRSGKPADERLLIRGEDFELPSLTLNDEVQHSGYLFQDKEKGFEAKADLWLLPQAQLLSVLSEKAMLSDDDILFSEKISHEPTRRRFLATRILSRVALSHFTEHQVPVEDWKFQINPFGKPDIISPRLNTCFNISHSEDVSVVTVSDCGAIGVDIEKLAPQGLEELPLHVLSEAEKKRLELLDGPLKYETFLDYWTLKEAYAKAVGKGVSLEFEKLEVSLNPLSLSSVNDEPLTQPVLKTMALSHQSHSYKLAFCLQG